MKLNSGDLLESRGIGEVFRKQSERENVCLSQGYPERQTNERKSFQGIGKHYWRLGQSKVWTDGRHPGGLVKVQRQCTGWQLCLALGGISLCYMTYLVRPTHIMEGDLPNVGAPWSSQLARKINHQNIPKGSRKIRPRRNLWQTDKHPWRRALLV